MALEDNLEQRLEKLGQVIGDEDGFVETVMAKTNTQPEHSLKFRKQALIRRITMNRLVKLAAAAVIVIAAALSINLLDKLVTSAYAIEQTIEAYNSIRWLHAKEFYMLGQEKRSSELWIECEDYGRLSKFRFQAPNCGGPILGPVTVVSEGNGSEAWLPNFNLCFRTASQPDNASVFFKWDMSEIDPKLVCERLYEQQGQGKIILDINEPDCKNEPIVLVVTYPQGSLSENWKKVLYIDQATRLVKKAEKFEMRDGQYQHIRTIEFFDYNQQIEPEMFSLDGELPENVIWVDQSDKEIGLAQGDMTNEEIATEVTLQFVQASIAKDFSRVGQLYLGVPDFLIEKLFGGNMLKIISVGPAHPDPDPGSNAMISSGKFLTEFGGQYYEINASKIWVVPVSGQPGRWTICGMMTSSTPAPDTITLSPDGADLNVVTYEGLELGEFMRKWLVLGSLPYPVRDNINFGSKDGQRAAFDTDSLDFVNFEPKIIIDNTDYEWVVLESEYNIIDLTPLTEEKNDFQIVYLWAQIEMSESSKAVLGIGSDDGVKVWLNGELVHENWLYREVVPDNDRVPVNFKKGTNQLVLKIQNALGPWGFCCRLLDE